MPTLRSELAELRAMIAYLQARVRNLESYTDNIKSIPPYTLSGGIRDRAQARPVDPITGLGNTFGGNLCFNDVELKLPPWGQKPTDSPTKGYNKHFHSRYSGGAFDPRVTEIVEFETDFDEDAERCPHCQQLWREEPEIAVDKKENKKISALIGNSLVAPTRPNMVWDENDECWRFYAVYAPDEPEEEGGEE